MPAPHQLARSEGVNVIADASTRCITVMKMGRERDILRWDIHATLVRERIAHLEAAIAPLREAASAETSDQVARMEYELTGLRHHLAALGPSPRAKMG